MTKMKEIYADQDNEDQGDIEAKKKSVAIEESNADAETEASEEYIYIRQQREKKEKFLNEAETDNIDQFVCFHRRTKAERHRVVPDTSRPRQQFSSNSREEKNANRPLSDAYDNCERMC
ncbi:hypothetical protein Plhal304r1_c017g0061261 [Plasmopara halstedii]